MPSTCLTTTEVQVIRSFIERSILVLDTSEGGLQERELALRAKLVALHDEVEKLNLDTRTPFPPAADVMD